MGSFVRIPVDVQLGITEVKCIVKLLNQLLNSQPVNASDYITIHNTIKKFESKMKEMGYE